MLEWTKSDAENIDKIGARKQSAGTNPSIHQANPVAYSIPCLVFHQRQHYIPQYIRRIVQLSIAFCAFRYKIPF
jgi:hypothetical protein